MSAEKNLFCCDCGKPATWVRNTQFAGKHPYCTEHAEKEEDFGKSDSYLSWEEISVGQIVLKHKTAVEGYQGQLLQLSERIHRIRYDKVKEFYELTALELRMQATGDRARGRNQLASLLDQAADNASQQQELFARIWALCEPHMEKE